MAIKQIPVSKLDEGIKKSMSQVRSLIESSKLLYEKRKFPESINLSILGKEEMTKLRVFRIHKKLNKPITNREWKLLRSHKKKLTHPYITAFERMRQKSITEIMELNQLMKKLGIEESLNVMDGVVGPSKMFTRHLESLDYLKQDCLYVNWVYEDWFSVRDNFNQNEKKSLAYVLLTELKNDYQYGLLAQNHPKLRGEDLLKTAESKRIKRIAKEMKSSKFKLMKNTVKKIMTEYYHPRIS